MIITFIIIQYDGLNTEGMILASAGYETKDGEPESGFMHISRLVVTIIGTVISVMLFAFVVSVSIFALTVGVLVNNGSLGNTTIMNR